ncbi:MAG: hypothetical protein LM583_09440 [Desulfurococcaceae archaeon]|nr:hypothetical protein [Desulfurococcaceae archaeon]
MSETQTSNPETQTQISIEPQEITQEQIKQLVEKAISEGKDEARLLLILEKWVRQGSAYVNDADFEVIYGEAEEVTLQEWDAGYPYERGTKYIIIPKTVPTIIRWYHVWDYGEDRGEREIVYVFTTEGWKSIRVK